MLYGEYRCTFRFRNLQCENRIRNKGLLNLSRPEQTVQGSKETALRQHPINFPIFRIVISSLNESKEHGKRNNSHHQQRPKRADYRGCDIDNAAAFLAPHTYHRKDQAQQDKNDIGSGPSGSDSVRQRNVQDRWGKSRQRQDAHNERSDAD